MAILDPVFANKQGQTPQDIERRRRMALELLAQSQENERITSPWQGAAKVAQALVGGYEEARANRDDKANRASANELLAKTLLGGDPYSPASSGASGSPVPMTGAANEMNPPMAGAPAFANDGTELGGYLSDPSRRSTLPAGMRNNNPGNIKFVGQKVPGIVGPSENTDQGDPQAVFATPEAGMQAMYQLALRKYQGGKVTPNQLIAGNMGWTPGNTQAAANVARSMGIGPDDDIRLTDPAMATKFIRGLILQEHGQKGALYPESMISSAIGGQPTQVASLDPAAGMPQQSMPAPEAQAQVQGPTRPAPALPPPTTVSSAPPVASVQSSLMAPSPQPQQQLNPQMMAQTSPSKRAQITALLQNPYTQEAGQQMLMQEYQRQQDAQNMILKQQLQQSDPKYRQDLEKGNLELQNLREPKMSPAEQAADQRDREKMAFERQKFEEEVKKGQWQKMTDGRLYNQTTGDFKDAPPPLPGAVPPKFDDISGMRKEIQQLPSYKNLAAAAPIYKAMAETAGRNTKASDLNLVYGLGKIMDPTSVVREGEMIMVKNTASLPDWFQGAIASLNGGAALTPETRQAIMTEAYGRVKGYNDEFQQNMGQYQGIVQRNGINPADVIPEVDKFEPWTPPAPSAPNIGNDWQELSPGVRIRKKAP